MRQLHRVFRQFAVPVAACAVITMVSYARDTDDSARTFRKAAELTDIRSPDSTPFELDANVEIRGNEGKFIPGSYKLIWVSPSEWREELSFRGYARVRVGGEERYWQQRSSDFEPLQNFELSEALDFVSSLRDEKSPGKFKTRKVSGTVLDCAEGGSPRKREYCFSGSESALVLEDVPSSPIDYQFVYSEFQTFGQKRFPSRIEVRVGPTTLAGFSVERLTSIEKPPSADFVPAVGSSLWLTCSNPQPPRLIHSENPVYPEQEKLAHHQGRVAIYAVITEDGSLQNLHVLDSPSQAMSDAALAAARQWKYEPRHCVDAATPTETVLDFFFGLGGLQ
jgi:TonB family protein